MSLTAWRHREAHGAVRGDDPAVGRYRVAGVGFGVRIRHIGADGDAARVGVLDDRDGRLARSRTRCAGRRRHRRSCCTTSPCRRAAWPARYRGPQGRRRERPTGGSSRRSAGSAFSSASTSKRSCQSSVDGALAGEPGRDGRVVRGRVGERLDRELATQFEGGASGRDRLEDARIVGRRDDDRHVRVVLRRCPHHRRSPDVDLLDDVVADGPRGDRLDERVQVGDDELERLDAQFGELRFVRSEPQVGEEPRVDAGMQGAHTTVEVLGETGHARHIGHRMAGLANPARGRAGCDDLDAGLDE